MVKKLQNIFKKITANPAGKAGVKTRRCKGGCGIDIEYKKDSDYEHAEYCDDCFDFIFARR